MGSPSLAEFSDKVSELMQVISREFLRHGSSDFYKTKLTLPQIIMLDTINRHGESRMSDLAGYASVTTAAITGIVDRLVRDGYIERTSDPSDRRIVKVKLTRKGAVAIEKITDHRKKMMMEMFGIISQKEREDYLKILLHIHDHVLGKNH